MAQHRSQADAARAITLPGADPPRLREWRGPLSLSQSRGERPNYTANRNVNYLGELHLHLRTA